MDLQLRKKSFLRTAGGEGLARHRAPLTTGYQKAIKPGKHIHNLVLSSQGKAALFQSHTMDDLTVCQGCGMFKEKTALCR